MYPKKNMTKNRKVLEGFLFALMILVIWQLLYFVTVEWLQVWKPYSVPSPIGVWNSLVLLLKSGTLIAATGYSLLRGAVGFIIAIIIGILFGLLINQFDFLNRNLKPVILGMQTLPSVCWVPFSILWFGLSQQSIIFVVVMGSAFSMSLAVDNGIRNVPPLYKKVAVTMGATKKDLYFKVIFPASVPALIAGLKQGWSFAWRALMAGEVMSSTTGLGQTLIIGRDMADINQVMLVMIIIILVGVIIDKCVFSFAEERVLKKRGL